MKPLLHCDELFLRFFDPWYKEETRKRRGFKATMPDISTNEKFINMTAAELSPFLPDGQKAIAERIAGMTDAMHNDFQSFLSVRDPIDESWVDEFDKWFDRARIQKLIDASDPTNFGNDYVVTCCEFGALLGYILKQRVPRLEWLCLHPYWDSYLFNPAKGNMITPFHWAIKKMSEYGVEDGFCAKINACVQFIDEKRTLRPHLPEVE